MASGNQRDSAFDRDNGPKQKPPCSFCNGLHHGIWACRQFEQRSVEERWNFAREKHLCFRCLSKDHRGKECRRSQPCKVNGCQLNHQRLLPRQTAPREGADSREGAIHGRDQAQVKKWQ